MKKKLMLFAVLAAFAASAVSQRSPEHPFDFKEVSLNDLIKNFDSWVAGTQPTGVSVMDDQFYISRVRPLERIVDGDYNARGTTVDRNRKLCLWVPLDDPTTTWKSMPRYCFEGDNFSMWSYVDIHGNWTAPWFRSPAGLADVAHKNGVKIGCVYSVAYGANVTLTGTDNVSRNFQKVMEKNGNGTFKHSLQLAKLMKYYGIDGIGVNSEFGSNSNFMNQWIAFIQDCHVKAKEIGWDFQLHWYDGTNSYGSISFDRGLGSHNQAIFGDKDHVTTDMLFFNYNWTNSILSNSVTNAKNLGRSSFDLYAGFDIQGRAFNNNNWSALKNNDISIGLWGAHAQSLLHQSATDEGTSDYAIQKTYQRKLELTFSGGNRNPQLVPAINTSSSLSNSDLTKFHGLATFISAKSTIQQVPFVTRFNLGNGLKFRNGGQVTFDHKWYNLGTQDFMPTWRWWITNERNTATATFLKKAINAELTFDDAYFGGSCLSLTGTTDFSRVKLFKTMLTMQPDYTFSVTYKMKNDVQSHAKLFVALKQNVKEFKEIEIPAASSVGEWTTFTATASQLGLAAGDVVAMIGLCIENSPADYEMLVGELAVRNPAQTFSTVAPTIKEVQLLRGRYNALDFKMRYAAKEESSEEKTYNDEVGTWYYEIYFQQENQPVQLLTATPSWAAYVIDAPLVPGTEGRRGRFGVRAVAPDGQQGSDIVWTDYQDIPYNEAVTDVSIDKQIVKAGETFSVGLVDVMGKPAKEWRIVNPLNDKVVASSANTINLTTSIDEEGLYDLYFTDTEGNTTVTRGMIQITPTSTGAVPQIETLQADKTDADAGKDITFAYTSRDGEGSVSRALKVMDPQKFMIPGGIQKGNVYSYALWFKVESFAHDKQGTNLINKNTIADSWPHNNWGDLWVTIRPAIPASYKDAAGNTVGVHEANEISYNVMCHNCPHDSPNENMMSKGYSVTPGVWNHLVITSNGNHQEMYFNGRPVAITNVKESLRREDLGKEDSRIKASTVANIFIGGGNVYKAGFNGWIDEVQVWDKALTEAEVLQAMRGYDADKVPDGLQAYYTFEEMSSDGTFPNLGKAGKQPGKVVITADSGGESTSSASYVQQDADNEALGYPGIPGSLAIKTVAEWNLPGTAVQTSGDKQTVVRYNVPGKYDAGLTLTNRWGSDTKVLPEYINVTGEVGIDDVTTESDDVAVLARNGSVNLRFAKGGIYTVRVYSVGGACLQTNQLSVGAGQTVNVALAAANAGACIVRVSRDGRNLRTVKLLTE